MENIILSLLQCRFSHLKWKGCVGPMKPINQTLSRKDAERRIPILRKEIDAELAALHQAMIRQDPGAINLCKEKLEILRREMILLEI